MKDDATLPKPTFEERNAAILEEYRALKFDPFAKASTYHFPCVAVLWSDEAPGGDIIPRDSREMHRFMMGVLQARAEVWLGRPLEPHFQSALDRMEELVPNWPGFLRMTVDEIIVKHLLAIEEGYRQAADEPWDDEA